MNIAPQTYRWRIKKADETTLKLADEIKIKPIFAQLLQQRGIRNRADALHFFNDNSHDLQNPMLMKDMDIAVKRVKSAMLYDETILIYGDYDVDGTTSVAMMKTGLEILGHVKLLTYIPDRYTEGYGISFQGIDYAIENKAKLMIALDCGIKANEKIAYAKEKGLDVIICDHHRPSNELPPALAILDPKREDCSYPFKELSGCGVGFKLIQALAFELEIEDKNREIWELLDYVAISIACDIVPVLGENRILLNSGLFILNSRNSVRPGIAALTSHIADDKAIEVNDLVFSVGPRINAAGRIDHGRLAVSLLCTKDPVEAELLFLQINSHNDSRKELDKSITEEALRLTEENGIDNKRSNVVFQPHWHKGVIGIVASRLIEKHYKPTIVLTESNGKATGSARSVKGFDVYNAIEACSELLEQFGGHTYAAGLTLDLNNLNSFIKRFEEVVSQTIQEESLYPEIEIDAEIDLESIDWRFFNTIKRFAPFGPGNMKPTFVSHHLTDTGQSRIVGSDKSHLRLVVRSLKDRNIQFTGIGFGLANKFPLLHMNKGVSVVYQLEENIWNENRSIQLIIKDICLTDELEL